MKLFNLNGVRLVSSQSKTLENKGDLKQMKLGIVGLPNVGKSTLFNAITKAGAQSANYPFCTIEPNVGVVDVPDKRLDVLAEMYNSAKVTPAAIEFVDIAGLVKGASKGEGLGNKFLSHIREVDAIIHVVRCFEDGNIIHVEGSVDAMRDVETINLELMMADIEAVDKRLEKARKMSKSGEKKYLGEIALLERIKSSLEAFNCVRTMEFDEEEQAMLKEYCLLTSKPVIYAANVSEEDFVNGIENNSMVAALKTIADKEGSEILPISAKIEEDISTLEGEEKQMFLEELNLTQSGLDRLISKSYELLGLISYLTSGPDETRAWTIKKGTKAPQAAGKIHTDFERGFIRAEVIAYDDLMANGTMLAAKEKGLVRSEGKEYVVKDGDIILFRFNV